MDSTTVSGGTVGAAVVSQSGQGSAVDLMIVTPGAVLAGLFSPAARDCAARALKTVANNKCNLNMKILSKTIGRAELVGLPAPMI
jgi:hypothetical protein